MLRRGVIIKSQLLQVPHAFSKVFSKVFNQNNTSCTHSVTLAQVVKPQRMLALEISGSFPRQLSLSNLLEFGAVAA